MIRQSALLVACVFLAAQLQPVLAGTPILNEVQTLSAAGNVSDALYSSQYKLLFLRDSTNDVRVINAVTGTQLSLHNSSATGSFTDFMLSPSGRYLFVADYGGTNIGYDSPLNPSYVHRYDLQTNTWTSAQVQGIGVRIEPVDDNRVLLLGVDQWVDLTLNTYAPGAMTQLSTISPGYSGNIEYDPNAGRIFYNETGLSSENIRSFILSGNTMTSAQVTPGASYGNYSAVLSTDGNTLYYNKVGYSAANITQSVATFAEAITAAGPTMAFGASHYYDPMTGTTLGAVGFTPLTWTVDANGKDVWAVQQPSGGAATLHHFLIAAAYGWSAPGGGSWANAANWLSGSIADGIDNTADFSQVTLTADATMTLDGNHTIGQLTFGDLGGTKNWAVSAGSGGTLFLQVSTGVPKIIINNQTTTINAPLSSTQGFDKLGAGTLILAANNLIAGDTTIDGGTLQVSADGNLGNGALTINAGTLRTTSSISSSRNIVMQNAAAAIQVDGTFTYTALAGATISGTGGLTKLGLGTLDLTAATGSYTGATSVNAGTLNVNALNSTATIAVAPGATLNVAASNLTLGSLSNSGTVGFTSATGVITLGTLSGNGVTTFGAGATLAALTGGTITVAGPATIATASGGSASLNGAAAIISTLSNTAVTLGSGTALTVSAGTQTAGGISGAGSLTKVTTGSLVLAFSNTYSGGTTISAGTLQIGNGSTSGSIVGNVTDNGTLIFNRSDSYTFGGLISGSGSLRQSGLGTLTLTNTNSYAGATFIDSGTLLIGTDSNLGSGPLTINAGTFRATGSISSLRSIALLGTASTIQVDDTFTYTALAGATLSGTGGLTKVGLGTLDLTAATGTYSGATSVNAGTLSVNTLSSSAQVFVGPGAALNVGTSNLTLGGLANSGTVGFTGATGIITLGTLSGSGVTTFAAGATLAAQTGGTVNVAGPSIITTATGGVANLNGITATIGTLNNTAVTLGSGAALFVSAGTQTAGGVAGAGSLTKVGTGALVLGFANTYTGGTTISAGSLQVGNGSAAGSIAGNVSDNGTFIFSRSDSTTFGGIISGSGIVRQSGTGTTSLTGVNTYSGGTFIDSGTLLIGADNNLGTGPLTINAGILRVSGSITSSRAIALQSSAAAILVDDTYTYSVTSTTPISGPGGLTKLGLGTLDLTAASILYTGATTVSAGALSVNTLNSTAPITVAAGATLNVTAINLVLGALSNAGTVAFTGTGAVTVGTLSGSGVTTFAGGANLATLSGGTVSVGGIATISTASGGAANLNGLTATINTLSNTAVTLGSNTTIFISTGTQTAGGITGAGSVSKAGTGALILAYSNSYAGGTTISAGTLQIGNGSTTGSIIGNVTDNGTLIFNRSDSYVFGGLISGSGAVRQNGPGTLTLINLNSYTGGTTIAGGVLALGDGVLAGSVVGNVADSGMLIFNTPAAGQSCSGLISGTGAVTKTGPGTQVLSGSNSYSGGTTILAGVLQVGDGTTNGSFTGNVITGGALVFNRADSISFTGSISGPGRVEQAGNGTLTLTGIVNSPILARKGRIILSAASNFSGDVTVAATGRLDNGGTSALHIANLDNAGVLSGEMELTGTFLNRTTGDVRLAAGQKLLALSTSGHTNSGLVEVLGNAASTAEFETAGPLSNSAGTGLIVARNANLRFDGGLTNSGSLSMNYGSIDVFGKINNEAGSAISIAGGAGVTFYDDVVQNGSLVVAAIGSTHSSAVFLGSFTGAGGFTGGGDVFLMGDLRPGNSPAEVTFGGNLALSGATSTVMEVAGTRSGSQYDKVNVSGTLSLSGKLTIELLDGFVPKWGDTFDLFDATTVSGQFSSLTLPALPGALKWDVSKLYTSGTITASPLNGDATLDGAINIDDYLQIDRGFLRHLAGWSNGDFNGDGVINYLDYALMDATYAAEVGNQADSEVALHTAEFGRPYVDALSAANPGAVPEPASLALLALGGGILLTRRRRFGLAGS